MAVRHAGFLSAYVGVPADILTYTAPGVVEALVRCLSQTPATESARLCDPCVRQIFKLKREGEEAHLSSSDMSFANDPDDGHDLLTRPCPGQFCGYRNIQMLISYIVASKIPGSRRFRGKIPSIFELQDGIEAAWAQGISPEGLIETGGIKGTRKFIGTPEVRGHPQILSMTRRC